MRHLRKSVYATDTSFLFHLFFSYYFFLFSFSLHSSVVLHPRRPKSMSQEPHREARSWPFPSVRGPQERERKHLPFIPDLMDPMQCSPHLLFPSSPLLFSPPLPHPLRNQALMCLNIICLNISVCLAFLRSSFFISIPPLITFLHMSFKKIYIDIIVNLSRQETPLLPRSFFMFFFLSLLINKHIFFIFNLTDITFSEHS